MPVEADNLVSRHGVGPPSRHLGLMSPDPGCGEDGVPSAMDFADA